MRLIDADKIKFINATIAPHTMYGNVLHEIIAYKKEIDALPTVAIDYEKTLDKMKNCQNCAHKGVCYIRKERINSHADDYSPCIEWRLSE